jgi:hypothetical protein
MSPIFPDIWDRDILFPCILVNLNVRLKGHIYYMVVLASRYIYQSLHISAAGSIIYYIFTDMFVVLVSTCDCTYGTQAHAYVHGGGA